MTGKKITWKTARLIAGFSQKDVAKALQKLGISEFMVGYYERKPDKMPMFMASALCHLYEIPISDIFLDFKSTVSRTNRKGE